jgi:hypothetical protein
MPLDALTLPTRLRISFPPHNECLERELEPRTIAALQEDAARAYEELFSCELAPGNQRFHLYLMLDSDPTQPRVLLTRERQLTRYITVDDSGQFVVLRVQAEPQQEDLAGEIKKPEILFAVCKFTCLLALFIGVGYIFWSFSFELFRKWHRGSQVRL